MKVTLKKLCASKGYADDQVFLLKREMLMYKKSGQLFFKEDLASLDLETPFEIYYYQMPNPSTTVDAFPVPKEHFQHKKNNVEVYSYLKDHFETYYEKQLFEQEALTSYSISRPFFGEDYVWYYKTSSFS